MDGPATTWHRTSFTLELPADRRALVGLRLADTPGEGLLHPRERNELVLAHWRRTQCAARADSSVGSLGLEAYPAHRRVLLRVRSR